MIENEDSCVYCSKSLVGLNNFNKRMHIETCKVRKIVDDNPNKSHLELDEIMVVGDNCSYCFKSFKDFKSEFNKRLHVKCCKIKKETNEEKQSMKCQAKGESCLFCTKPLENLNEFNKRMHVENCKIRKSLEGNSKKETAQANMNNPGSMGLELGDNCAYCGKSFLNLSNFNKKLHFDHCKLKKKKMGGSGGVSSQDTSMNIVAALSMNNQNTQPSATTSTQNHAQHQHSNGMSVNTNGNHNQNNYASLSMSTISYDLGETCVFCSRSLKNLSNFNKRIHIETCKVKKFKIATAKLRQEARKAQRKGGNCKKDKDSQINFIPNNQMQANKPPMTQTVNLNQMPQMMHIGNLNTINSLQAPNQNPANQTNLNATIASLTNQNQYATNNAAFVHQQQPNNNIYI